MAVNGGAKGEGRGVRGAGRGIKYDTVGEANVGRAARLPANRFEQAQQIKPAKNATRKQNGTRHARPARLCRWRPRGSRTCFTVVGVVRHVMGVNGPHEKFDDANVMAIFWFPIVAVLFGLL
jgi:hypothetical protein